MAREPQRPGFAAYGGSDAFEPPLGRPLAAESASRGGVGGGVTSSRKVPSAGGPLAAYLKKQRVNRGK